MRERLVPRVCKQLTIFLVGGSNGELVDLSLTGLRLQTRAPLSAGHELEGTLILDDGQPVELRGRVAWVKPVDLAPEGGSEAGIELRECPERYREAVTRYFAEA